MSGFSGAADLTVSVDLKGDDLVTAASTLSDESKKLPKLRVSVSESGCVGVGVCVGVGGCGGCVFPEIYI